MRVVKTTDIDTCQAIRRTVFIEGQGVSEAEEVDGMDGECDHYLLFYRDDAIGTLRILTKAPGLAKVQRVAVLPKLRGIGAGAYLMREVMAMLRAQGVAKAVLGSQVDVIPFYETLGFTAHGPEYDDAGIQHRDMTRDL